MNELPSSIRWVKFSSCLLIGAMYVLICSSTCSYLFSVSSELGVFIHCQPSIYAKDVSCSCGLIESSHFEQCSPRIANFIRDSLFWGGSWILRIATSLYVSLSRFCLFSPSSINTSATKTAGRWSQVQLSSYSGVSNHFSSNCRSPSFDMMCKAAGLQI